MYMNCFKVGNSSANIVLDTNKMYVTLRLKSQEIKF